MYCVPTELQVRSAKVEKKPLEIKIGTPTPNVKIQVMSGDKSVSKVPTMKVCPDLGATADLIKESTAALLGCKLRTQMNI